MNSMNYSVGICLLHCRSSHHFPAPTLPTPIATYATTTTPAAPLPPTSLIDQELLELPNLLTSCDAPAEVQFTCENEVVQPLLKVAISASTYARWRLQLGEATTALTGNETLILHLHRQGNLTPNLYLVERTGRRVNVPLARYGLVEGEQTLAVPLREVKDEQGAWPDFAAVNELQIVFEWADMAGELTLQSLQFASAWQTEVGLNPETPMQVAGLQLPAGFVAEAVADALQGMTQIQFTPDGTLWVSQQEGRIWRYQDVDGDGRYERRLLYGAGFPEIVGLLPDPVDGALWVGGRGQLERTLDEDGNGAVDLREVRLEGLPWGRHQNNGLAWNPLPDPFSGETHYHWLYFGLGSTEDLGVGGEYNATVLRFPRTGQGQADLQIVSRGNRNAYTVLWAPVPVDPANPTGATRWQLFASENGPDFNNAPDEVNHIRWQHNYGFPDQFGPVAAPAVEGQPYSGPVYAVPPHSSADGLTYITNPAWPLEYRTLYVSLFGQIFNPDIVGHTVERITLSAEQIGDETTYRGVPSTFVAGLDRPLPLTVDVNGNLIVGDYATGIIYRVRYVAE